MRSELVQTLPVLRDSTTQVAASSSASSSPKAPARPATVSSSTQASMSTASQYSPGGKENLRAEDVHVGVDAGSPGKDQKPLELVGATKAQLGMHDEDYGALSQAVGHHRLRVTQINGGGDTDSSGPPTSSNLHPRGSAHDLHPQNRAATTPPVRKTNQNLHSSLASWLHVSLLEQLLAPAPADDKKADNVDEGRNKAELPEAMDTVGVHRAPQKPPPCENKAHTTDQHNPTSPSGAPDCLAGSATANPTANLTAASPPPPPPPPPAAAAAVSIQDAEAAAAELVEAEVAGEVAGLCLEALREHLAAQRLAAAIAGELQRLRQHEAAARAAAAAAGARVAQLDDGYAAGGELPPQRAPNSGRDIGAERANGDGGEAPLGKQTFKLAEDVRRPQAEPPGASSACDTTTTTTSSSTSKNDSNSRGGGDTEAVAAAVADAEYDGDGGSDVWAAGRSREASASASTSSASLLATDPATAGSSCSTSLMGMTTLSTVASEGEVVTQFF
ncbi:hypothetical protein HK405_004849, partial [Cladochytrium tenue]